MLGNLAFMQGTLFININKLLFRQRSLENTCLIPTHPPFTGPDSTSKSGPDFTVKCCLRPIYLI